LIDANDAFLAMLGVNRAALRAGALQDLKLARDPGERSSGDGHAVLAPYETWFPHRDGRHVPVMVAAADSPGAAGERFSIVVDLSEREARERFEQEFLADVAHDLRNPLAATKAQAQVMRRRLNANRLERDALEDGLATIIANSTRMARRIEELTDVAQLRAGHALELMREPVDLVALAENTAETYRQATERKEIRIESSQEALVGNWDMSRIERVVDNLLSNAVKYSPRGGPIIVAVSQDVFGGRECARVAITDHGVGIPASDLVAIFDRFQRGSNVRGRVNGSGIGLAGARTIVERHGGAITVESELGAGSTFTVHLPLRAPEEGDGA
jgi:signal transduction histidine kinase